MKRWIAVWVCGCLLAGCGGGAELVDPSAPAVDAPAAETPGAAEKAAEKDPYAGHELTGEPQVIEALAMTINDQVITINDVFAPVADQLTEAGRTGDKRAFLAKAGEIIGAEIQRQIGQILVFAEAEKSLKEPEIAYLDQMVADHLRDRILAAGGSRARLAAEYRAEGVDLDEVMDRYRRRLISRHYLQRKFVPQLGATCPEMWRYYETHKDEFSTPATVKMQIMAFPYDVFYPAKVRRPTAEQKAAARKLAKAGAAAALERVAAGDDFSRIVRDDSISRAFRATRGGVWDHLPAGSFRESAVEEAAFAQPVGAVSDMIICETGVFLVKTLDRRPGRTVSFEDAQKTIDNKIRDQQYAALSADYYRRLHERAVIQQGEAFEKFALSRAVALYFQPKP